MRKLTPNQMAFVSYLVLGGYNPTEAARYAGYRQPKVRAYELLRKPHIEDAIYAKRYAFLNGPLIDLSLHHLKALLESANTPDTLRIEAIRTIFELRDLF